MANIKNKTIIALGLVTAILFSLFIVFPLSVDAATNDWPAPWETGVTLQVGQLNPNSDSYHATWEGKISVKYAIDFLEPNNRSGVVKLYSPVNGTIICAEGNYTAGASGCKGGHDGYGNHIIIGGDGEEIVMAHFSSLDSSIKAGNSVSKGQFIGYLGSTGTSTWAHLHFELRTRLKSSNISLFGKPKSFFVQYALLSGGIGSTNGGSTSATTNPPTTTTNPTPTNPQQNGDIKIITACFKVSNVELGKNAPVYVKTSDNITKVELIDSNGSSVASTSSPTTNKSGEKEWDFGYTASGSTGARIFKIRATGNGKTAEYNISITVYGSGGGGVEKARASSFKDGTGQDYSFAAGQYPDLAVYDMHNKIDFFDTSGTLGVIGFIGKNFTGPYCKMYPNKSMNGNCAWDLTREFGGAFSKKINSIIVSSNFDYIKTFEIDPVIKSSYCKQTSVESGKVASLYAKTTGIVTKVALIGENGSEVASTSTPTTYNTNTDEKEWDWSWTTSGTGVKSLKVRAYSNSGRTVDYAVTITIAAPPPNPTIQSVSASPSSVEVNKKTTITIITNSDAAETYIYNNSVYWAQAALYSANASTKTWTADIYPSSAGQYTLTAQARNGSVNVTKTFVLTVTNPPPPPPIPKTATFSNGTAPSQTTRTTPLIATLDTGKTIMGTLINDCWGHAFDLEYVVNATIPAGYIATAQYENCVIISGEWEPEGNHRKIFPGAVVSTRWLELWWSPNEIPPSQRPSQPDPQPNPIPSTQPKTAVLSNGESLSQITRTTPLTATFDTGAKITGTLINDCWGHAFDFGYIVEVTIPKGYIATAQYENCVIISGEWEPEGNHRKIFPGAIVSTRWIECWFSPNEIPPSQRPFQPEPEPDPDIPAPIPNPDPQILTAIFISTDVNNGDVSILLSDGTILPFEPGDCGNSMWFCAGRKIRMTVPEGVFDLMTVSRDGIDLDSITGRYEWGDDSHSWLKLYPGATAVLFGAEGWFVPKNTITAWFTVADPITNNVVLQLSNGEIIPGERASQGQVFWYFGGRKVELEVPEGFVLTTSADAIEILSGDFVYGDETKSYVIVQPGAYVISYGFELWN